MIVIEYWRLKPDPIYNLTFKQANYLLFKIKTSQKKYDYIKS